MAKTLTLRVVKATSMLGSTQAVNMFCSVVRMKLLALFVGPVGVGLLGAVSQAADMIGNLSQLNVRTSAVPALASASKEQFSPLLVSVRRISRLLGLVGATVMFLAAPLLADFTFGNHEFIWAYRIAALSLFFVALSGAESIVLQATQNYKSIAASGLFTALTALPLSVALYFILRVNGVAPSLVVYSLMAFIGAWWFSRSVSCNGVKPRWGESLKIARPFLKTGLALTLITLATDGVNFIFMAFMGNEGETVLGLYQAGYKIVWNYTGLFLLSFSAEFFPRISRCCHNRRASSVLVAHQGRVSSLITAAGVIVIIVCARWLVPLLYSAEFAAVLPYVRWGAVGICFRPLSMAMSFFMLAAGKTKAYCWSEVLSALCGLALNVLGFSVWGFMGLGLATILWQALDLLIVFTAGRFAGLTISPRCLLLPAALSAVALTAAWLC